MANRKVAMCRRLLVVSFCVMACGCWVKQSTSGPAVRGHSMAYDSVHQQVMFFGGVDSTGFLDKTQEWNGTAWTPISNSNPPAARLKFAMACDTFRNTVVLFGGVTAGTEWSDTWEWNGTKWTEVNPLPNPRPDPRHHHAMAYDSARHVVVLFGGYTSGDNTPANPRRNLNDTWEWDGMTGKWTMIDVPPDKRPPARDAHAMAYDAKRGKVVMFGGAQDISTVTYLDDVWEWNGSEWKQVPKSGTWPPPRGKMTMAYDENNQKVMMFGGLTAPAMVTPTYFDDAYFWDGTSWTLLKQPWFTHAPPTGRYDHAMAYDSKRKAMVMFGGLSVNPVGPSNPPELSGETWERFP